MSKLISTDGTVRSVSTSEVAGSAEVPDENQSEAVRWLSTQDAARRIGITQRTLYRFIDEGQVPAYRFGRVIRLKIGEVDQFIDGCRIQPGTLEHLYPETLSDTD